MSVAMTHRDTCRLCESGDVELVLPLAPSAIADAFVPGERLDEPQEAYPLDVYLCRSCGHVQLLDVLDPEALFANYIYTTQGSPGLQEHFAAYADELVERTGDPARRPAVDIGSNDGSLLRLLQAKGFTVHGVDPARDIAARASDSGIPTTAAFFDRDVAARLRDEHGPAAVITANNVFAHADDLGGIASGIADLLAPDGMFVFEVSYLLDTVQNMVFDYVYHEHLAYHAVKPMRSFLARHGMELFDVRRIPTKGGSIRGFAQLAGGPRVATGAPGALVAEEDAAGLDDPDTYSGWAERIDAARAETRRVLADAVRDGARIAGFGASATGTTLMHHFGLDDFVTLIVDDNPDRQGLYSPGHHVPVVSPDVLYEDDGPSHTVVLAWRFAEPIARNHAGYLERGGTFVVPLPEVRILDSATARTP